MCLHLADELTTESVDDTSDRGLLALADEVEVKHALDGLGLHAAVKVLSALGSFCSDRVGDREAAQWTCAASHNRLGKTH